LGDSVDQVESAIRWLADHPEIELIKHTPPMRTKPWGLKDQPWFVNAAAEVTTRLDPDALLEALKAGEQALGRTAGGVKWGPREIDLDILLYGDRVIETERLTVPHPHLTDRPFILDQLIALDPGLTHPKFNRPLRDLGPGTRPVEKK
jgi:2-amino-4-hydroxy-6-hydroxymethyldihydropteridine diphosphokinase